MIEYPPYITWEITDNCNHRCIHCYNFSCNSYSHKEDHKRMDAIYRFIVERQPVDVTITGGEPLMVFDDYMDYIDGFIDNGISVRINCNGSLITKRIATFCAQRRVRMMISFPSHDEEIFHKIAGDSASLQRVIDGIELAVKAGVTVSPNIVVSRYNFESLFTTCSFLQRRFGISELFISRITMPINADDGFESFMLSSDQMDMLYDICLDVKNKLGINIKSCGGYPFCSFNSEEIFCSFGKSCGAGNTGFIITNNGDIRACVRDDTVYGNLFENSFSFSDVYEKMNEWRDGRLIPQECRSCNAVAACRGGCRVYNKHKRGSLCDVDREMRMDRTPIVYDLSARGGKQSDIKESDYFSVLPFCVVKDGAKYRISSYVKCMYVDEIVVHVLKEHRVLNISEVSRAMKCSVNDTKNLLGKLLSIGVIRKREEYNETYYPTAAYYIQL